MKHLIFLPVMSGFFLLINHNFPKTIHISSPGNQDTSIIIQHKPDGIINEWPSSKFESDVSTDISYAIDNDGNNLYMALSIPNEGIQMKLMRMGMNLFIDLKGKRKEGRGISFPVKDESLATDKTSFADVTGIQNNDESAGPMSQKSGNTKAMRSAMALRLTYMNVFGFDGIEKHDQGLQMPGSINIAFAWDSSNVMHIEYAVPLKMLEDAASLKNKEISIGWRINGLYPSDKYQQSSERHRQHNRGTAGYGANTTAFDPSAKHISHETIIREQNIWTKYTLYTFENPQ